MVCWWDPASLFISNSCSSSDIHRCCWINRNAWNFRLHFVSAMKCKSRNATAKLQGQIYFITTILGQWSFQLHFVNCISSEKWNATRIDGNLNEISRHVILEIKARVLTCSDNCKSKHNDETKSWRVFPQFRWRTWRWSGNHRRGVGSEREKPSKRKAQKSTKKQKLSQYKFEEEDVRIIEEAIQRYGLNYSSIHEKYFKDKTSLNRLRKFIQSDEMTKLKEAAYDGKLEFNNKLTL